MLIKITDNLYFAGYAFVIYSFNAPKPFCGVTYGFIIKIRPKYKDDKCLLEHELTHARQFWRTFGLSHILRNLSKFANVIPIPSKWKLAIGYISKHFTLKYELEAYYNQWKCTPDDQKDIAIQNIAKFLSTRYGLDITYKEAFEIIEKYIAEKENL